MATTTAWSLLRNGLAPRGWPQATLCACILAVWVAAAARAEDVRSITVDGATVAYRVIGAGKPVLWLAGGPGLSSDYLDPLATSLAGTQAILVDLPGTGRSWRAPTDPQHAGIPAQLRDLEAIRAQLGLTRWIVAGHSFGGFLAQKYAAAYPDRVAALILIASAPGDLQTEQQIMRTAMSQRMTGADRSAYATLQGRTDIDDQERSRELAALLTPLSFADRSKADPAVALFLGSQYNPQLAAAALSDRSTLAPPVFPASFNAQVLIVSGAQDIGAAQIRDSLKRTFPHAHVAWVEHAGHYIWMEQLDSAHDAIVRFLSTISI